MKILLTGGAGFIGHHLVQRLLTDGHQLTLIDRLDHSGNLNRLAEIGLPNRNARFVFHDLRAPINSQLAAQIGPQDWILHLAAATHVDRSIEDPLAFVMDNVVATCNILDHARNVGCNGFLYFGTDEVFGPAPPGRRYKEDERYRSGNPYAATKAGAEELAISFHNTYQLPVIVTHTMNVIGERQHPEKFVPNTIAKVLAGEDVTIHADTTCTRPGSRFYIDAHDVADAISFLLRAGSAGQKYNIVGAEEVNNLELAQQIAQIMGRDLHYSMVSWHASRPGHDLRYALCGDKLATCGWKPPTALRATLERIVNWTLCNERWLKNAQLMEQRADKTNVAAVGTFGKAKIKVVGY
jgi:dTDP-glucose 4,6-dehydratase